MIAFGRNEEVLRRIKQRAKLFVLDNIKNPTMLDFIRAENCMMIGSVIKGEVEMEFGDD